MIDHVLIYVTDLSESKFFYEQSFKPLGYKIAFGKDGHFFSFDTGSGTLFEVAQYHGQNTLTSCHIAFRAKSEDQVQKFYEAAIQAGGRCNGQPGFRPQYTKSYYAAFVRDPNGHNIEAVFDPNIAN